MYVLSIQTSFKKSPKGGAQGLTIGRRKKQVPPSSVSMSRNFVLSQIHIIYFVCSLSVGYIDECYYSRASIVYITTRSNYYITLSQEFYGLFFQLHVTVEEKTIFLS